MCNIQNSVADVFLPKPPSNLIYRRSGRQQEQVLATARHDLLQTHGNLGWRRPELVRDDLQCEGLFQQMVPPISDIVKLRYLSATTRSIIKFFENFCLPIPEPRCRPLAVTSAGPSSAKLDGVGIAGNELVEKEGASNISRSTSLTSARAFLFGFIGEGMTTSSMSSAWNFSCLIPRRVMRKDDQMLQRSEVYRCQSLTLNECNTLPEIYTTCRCM